MKVCVKTFVSETEDGQQLKSARCNGQVNNSWPVLISLEMEAWVESTLWINFFLIFRIVGNHRHWTHFFHANIILRCSLWTIALKTVRFIVFVETYRLLSVFRLFMCFVTMWSRGSPASFDTQTLIKMYCILISSVSLSYEYRILLSLRHVQLQPPHQFDGQFRLAWPERLQQNLQERDRSAGDSLDELTGAAARETPHYLLLDCGFTEKWNCL